MSNATQRRPAPVGPLSSGRLALRLPEAADALGIGRRTLERLRASGAFPPPDLIIGKMPLWTPATLERWVAKGGAA